MEPLAAAYECCRQLHRRHGRSYYLATRLLPAWKRRHVHALYGFTRYADEIVDGTADLPVAQRAAWLAAWSARFVAGLGGSTVEDPLLPAVLHTIRVFDLDLDDFRKFLASMAMDLTVTDYATYDDLLAYMEGSAAVIATMMLPILGAADPAAAREPARQLGLAFQLTNFIRDVAEDLSLGRIYLPRADLQRFGLVRSDLFAAAAAGRATPAIKGLVAFEVRRAQAHYAAAAPGIGMLAPSSRACIGAAYRIYGAILDEVVRADYDVFVGRVVVPNRRRLALGLSALLARSEAPIPLPGSRARRVPVLRGAVGVGVGALGPADPLQAVRLDPSVGRPAPKPSGAGLFAGRAAPKPSGAGLFADRPAPKPSGAGPSVGR